MIKKIFKQNIMSNKIFIILLAGIILLTLSILKGQQNEQTVLIFNVMEYGAIGDGKTLDTKAIQKTIDEAAKVGKGTRVLIPTGRRYLIGTLILRSGIDFHLEGDAELLVSTKKEDYIDGGAIIAIGATGLSISGTGSINGRAMEFMSHYEKTNEWWIPKEWRPKLFILTKCHDLKVLDITINKAPSWSLHMLGCENVLVDRIIINNDLDVPNCDGINPDHCRNVEIRNCKITCGDDAIVVKATRQKEDYGPSTNIHVHDCLLETQDSGLKIGTETTQNIHNILFERCKIISSCRALTIQLRDEGNVFNVVFRDITFNSRYHSDPWWGRGEAISFTAIPRTNITKIGNINNILVENVTGTSENSIRINGTKESRISNVRFENVNVKLNRWTDYPGKLFDNRPTKVYEGIEAHNNPGIYIRFSDQLLLKDCSISWGDNIPDYFTNAIKAHDITQLKILNFNGEAAHPDRDKAILILEDNNN